MIFNMLRFKLVCWTKLVWMGWHSVHVRLGLIDRAYFDRDPRTNCSCIRKKKEHHITDFAKRAEGSFHPEFQMIPDDYQMVPDE